MSNLLNASISLHPSKIAIGLWSSLYLISVISIIDTDINYLIKALFIVGIFINAFYVFTQHILLNAASSIIGFSRSLSYWSCQKKEGKLEEIILRQLLSFRKVIIVRFSFIKSTKVHTRFLFEDNMSSDDFHYLLVQTRLFKGIYET